MLARQKILIVEDEPILADEIFSLLNERGYKALEPVNNYEDAVTLLMKEEPDLALVDIGLAGEKDGIELAGFITEHTYIPVVFITGYSDSITLSRAIKASAHSMILKVKPFLDAKALLQTIGSQLMANIGFALGTGYRIKIKDAGLFFKGREITITKGMMRKEYEEDEHIHKETFTAFENIDYITTHNAPKNQVLIKFTGQKGLVVREPLKEIEQKLPPWFVRVNDSYIANLQKITHRKDYRYIYINEESIAVLEKSQRLVQEKLRLFVSHLA